MTGKGPVDAEVLKVLDADLSREGTGPGEGTVLSADDDVLVDCAQGLSKMERDGGDNDLDLVRAEDALVDDLLDEVSGEGQRIVALPVTTDEELPS